MFHNSPTVSHILVNPNDRHDCTYFTTDIYSIT